MPFSYTPLFPRGSSGPSLPQSQRGANIMHNLLRDSLSIPAWLSLGAIVQTLLFMLPIKRYLVALPAILFVLVNTTDALLVTLGLRHNTMMDNVIQRKFTAMPPDADGQFSYLNTSSAGGDMKSNNGKGNSKTDSTDDDQVVVFLLGLRIHHPLGQLAPGVKELGPLFMRMQEELLAGDGAEHGVLGHDMYLSGDRGQSGNEIVHKYYFRSMDHLHAFANGEAHRVGWAWFDRITAQYPHIGVMHEAWVAPRRTAGAYETIYINYEPSHFAGSSHLRRLPSSSSSPSSPSSSDEKTALSSISDTAEKEKKGTTTTNTPSSPSPYYPASPIVDVGRGRLASSKGRLEAAY